MFKRIGGVIASTLLTVGLFSIATPVFAFTKIASSQTITVTTAAPASSVYGNTFPVAASSTSGLPVAITTTGGCSIPPFTKVSGTVTMTSSTDSCVVHFKQAGNKAYDAASEITETVTTQKKALTVMGITASSKVYNATSTAILSGTGSLSAGLINGDHVFLMGTPVGTFSDKNVGVGKTVTISGLSIRGRDAVNYTLTQPTATANITAATLTYSANAATRAYGAADPSFSGTVSGFVGGETQGTATAGSPSFSTTANSLSPVGTYPINGSGLTANNGNYVFVEAAGNATAFTITKADQTISFGTLPNKTYGDADISLSASVPSGLPITYTPFGSCSISGSTLSITGAGTCTVTANQPGDANHNAAPAVSQAFTIAQKTVTASITAVNKVYDGTSVATLSGCTVSGLVPADAANVTCSAGSATFSDKNVGTGKTVTATGITLGGSAAANYFLSPNTAIASANITQLDITPLPTGVNKTYDGTTDGMAIYSASPAIFIGDAVTFSGTATFASSTVAMNVPMSVTGISISGLDAGNYNLLATTASTTANITQSVGSIQLDKSVLSYVYDGTAKSLPVLSTSPVGLANIVTYSGSTAAPSAANTYSVFASILDNNYAGTDNASLVISKAPLSITASSTGKIFGQADPALTYSITSGQLYGDVLTGGLVRDIGENAGTYAINLGTLSAGSNYAITYVPGAIFTISKADQTISFGTLSNKVFPGPTFNLSATASSSLPVSFDALTSSSTCSISGTTVTLLGLGTCAVTAHQEGGMNYNAAADVTQSFDVLPADLTAPIITLQGDATTTVKVGSVYEDAGATALDNVDGDLTYKLSATSTVNTAIPGTYSYSYNVSDAAGNAATTTSRTVIVRPLGTDASLSALSLAAGTFTPDFASSTYAYSIVLPYGTASVPAAFATTTDPNASSEISNAATVTGTTTVTVTAEDATTTQAYMISFSVAPAPSNPGEPSSGSGSGSPSVVGTGSRMVVGGGVSGSSAPASSSSQGSVLGASTGPQSCVPYLKSFLRFGAKNDPLEVMLLQKFLNQFDGEKLAVSGVFDSATFDAVKVFQKKHADKILAPWKTVTPTGIVSLTTLKTINEVYCGTANAFPLTAAQLAELARIKALVNGEAPLPQQPVATSSDSQQDQNSITGTSSAASDQGTTTPKTGFFGGIWGWFGGKK